MSAEAPRVFVHLLEENFEELDFLWEQREALRDAPDWTLRELAELEVRAEAHLDGLRIGGERSRELAREHLHGATASAATAAATVFLLASDAAEPTEVAQAFSVAEGPALDGLRIALRHFAPPEMHEVLAEFAEAAGLPIRCAAADVLAFRRALPDVPWEDLLAAEAKEGLANAYEALGRARPQVSFDALRCGILHEDPSVRRAALRAAAKRGAPELRGLCRELALGSEPVPAEVIAFLGVAGDRSDVPALQSLLGDAERAIPALAALGGMGAPASLAILLHALEVPELKEAAGAAFLRITGAEDLEGAGPGPNPDEDEEAPDPDLDPALARAWVERESRRLESGIRWQSGRQCSEDALGPGFDELPLAVRRDLHLRACLEHPGQVPDRELEALALRQLGLRSW